MDSAFVKANASLENLCEKQLADEPTPVLHVADRPAQDAPDARPFAPAQSTTYGASLRLTLAMPAMTVAH